MKHLQTIAAVAVAGLCGESVCAQCVPEWSTFNPQYATIGLTIWDEDGPGPMNAVLVSSLAMPPAPTSQVQAIPIVKYDGRAWRPIGEPLWGDSQSANVWSIAVCSNNGANSPAPGLYATGKFETLTGGAIARHFAHFDGEKWNAMPFTINGFGYGMELVMFDEDGDGPDEPNLFIGGHFFDINGFETPGLLRWDGTELTTVGGGLSMIGKGNPNASALMVWDDDGPGPREPALYVAGNFDFVDGRRADGIARWTGTEWETLGLGLNNGVLTIMAFDADGDGPEPEMLYVGGGFRARDPQGNPINMLARFDGTNWEQVETYDGGGVYQLEVFDEDGQGPLDPKLIVSGLFYGIAGVPANAIIRWDGTNWEAMGEGLTGLSWPYATDMQVFDEDNDPSTPAGLYVGGNFFWAGGLWSPGHGRWGCPNPVCFADCDETTGVGNLDIFDFLCFQTAFVTADPYACDCDALSRRSTPSARTTMSARTTRRPPGPLGTSLRISTGSSDGNTGRGEMGCWEMGCGEMGWCNRGLCGSYRNVR